MKYNKYMTEHVKPNRYFYVRGGIFKKKIKVLLSRGLF